MLKQILNDIFLASVVGLSQVSQFDDELLKQRNFNPYLSNIDLKDIKLFQNFILGELEKMLNLTLTSKIIDSIIKIEEKGKEDTRKNFVFFY